jgi:DNA replication initiation complex subunit (GINS family)
MPKSNSKSKAQTKVVGTTIQAMVEEGKALKEIWEKRITSQRRTFTSDTNAEGFDTRLGKLLQQLKASSSLDSGQISRQVLTTHGLHVIDRRRRSEALWFVENEVECREFIKASKKGFTSLTALQAAMRKASKEADTKPAKAEKVKATPAKAEPSNVGQSPAKPASKQDIFDKLVKVCEFSGIDMLEIAEMIIDHSEVGKYVQYTETSTEVAA